MPFDSLRSRLEAPLALSIDLKVKATDLWARDTVAVFVQSHSGLEGTDFNFNGWGRKQTHARDKDVAVNGAVFVPEFAKPTDAPRTSCKTKPLTA